MKIKKNSSWAVLLTCEHAGNFIPKNYRSLFMGREQVLETHRGLDIGALKMARYLSKQGTFPLIEYPYSRLLIEINRSSNSKKLWSEFSTELSLVDKNNILQKYYFPHHQLVKKIILNFFRQKKNVLHLGIHSFTPKLNGITRKNCQMGLLYDPTVKFEKLLCNHWKTNLRQRQIKARLNYPYLGKSDGLITSLRKALSTESLKNKKGLHYAGVEVEINQSLFLNTSNSHFFKFRKDLWDTLNHQLHLIGTQALQ